MVRQMVVAQLAALWQFRDFRKYLLARFISNLGNGMAPIALAFGILDLEGATAKSLSLVLAVQSFALVAMLPFGGVWADRLGRARAVGGSDVILGALIAVQAGLFISGIATVPMLVPFALVFGVLHAIWYPAFPAIAPAVVPSEHLQPANSIVSAASNGAYISGAAVAGVLVAGIGPGWAMAFDAATFIAAGALVWSLRRLTPRNPTGASTWQDLKTGWGEFRANRWVFIIVLAFAFIMMCFQGANGVLGPVLMKEQFSGAKSWAVIATVESIGFLAGSLIAFRIRPRYPMRVAMTAMFTVPLFIAALAVPAPLALLAAAAFVCGLGMDVFQVLWITALQKYVPSASLSRVSSYDAFGSLAFGPLGTALAGPVSLAVGLQPAFAAAATIMAIAIAWGLLHPSVWRLSDRIGDAPQRTDHAT
ncbi:MAG: MFS transporter [Actinobacteria bacterium]|nr:MFS transporter [Actinomycetota bacterium]